MYLILITCIVLFYVVRALVIYSRREREKELIIKANRERLQSIEIDQQYKKFERQQKQEEKRRKELQKQAEQKRKTERKKAEARTIIEHYEPIRRDLIERIKQLEKEYSAADQSNKSGTALEKLKKPLDSAKEKLFQTERKLEKAYFTINE